MTRPKTLITIIAATLAGALAVTSAAPSADACYASPEDMVRYAVRGHFWTLARGDREALARTHPDASFAEIERMLADAPPEKHRLVVRRIKIVKTRATALVELRANNATRYLEVELVGKTFNWRVVSASPASNEASLAMALLSKADALALSRQRARASRALAKR